MTRNEWRAWLAGSKLSTQARIVYIALSFHADATGQAWPSVPTLALEVGTSPSTVRRALRDLQVAGDLAAQFRIGQPTVYQLTANPSHTDRGTPVTVTPPPQSQPAPHPSQMRPEPQSNGRPTPVTVTAKGIEGIEGEKNSAAASPQGGGGAPPATFLPGTGWVTSPAADATEYDIDQTSRNVAGMGAARAALAAARQHPGAGDG